MGDELVYAVSAFGRSYSALILVKSHSLNVFERLAVLLSKRSRVRGIVDVNKRQRTSNTLRIIYCFCPKSAHYEQDWSLRQNALQSFVLTKFSTFYSQKRTQIGISLFNVLKLVFLNLAIALQFF